MKPFRAYWDKKNSSWDWKKDEEEEMKGIGQWLVGSAGEGPQIFILDRDLKENPMTRYQQSQNQLDDGTRSSE